MSSGVPASAAASRSELAQILHIAIPVILAELGWVFMGVVDTIMVGPLGPVAIGAVGVANAIFDVVGIFGIGLLLGLDTLISQSFGAGMREECDRWLRQGWWLAAVSSLLLMAAMEISIPLMRSIGVQPDVVVLAVPYIHILNLSLPPLLFYSAFRRYLQSISRVRPVMFALISANLINAVGNYLLIPVWGVQGSGWATWGARVYMMLVLAGASVLSQPALLRSFPRPDFARLRRLLSLGTPSALQILLEVGVFGTTTVLAGTLGAASLAAHHVALNIAATAFMIPLGLSSAGAVVVGQAIGRKEPGVAKRAGWLTIALAIAFMCCTALLLVSVPQYFVRLFTANSEVLRIALPLLLVAAVFQIFDGIQIAATGILRGAGDTRTPMFANLVAHWALGLPFGCFLCFFLGWGVSGLWIGLSTGLVIVGLVLLVYWWRLRL